MLLNTIPVYKSDKEESEDSEVEGLDELAHFLGDSG